MYRSSRGTVLALAPKPDGFAYVAVSRRGSEPVLRQAGRLRLSALPAEGSHDQVGRELRAHLVAAGVRATRCTLALPAHWSTRQAPRAAGGDDAPPVRRHRLDWLRRALPDARLELLSALPGVACLAQLAGGTSGHAVSVLVEGQGVDLAIVAAGRIALVRRLVNIDGDDESENAVMTAAQALVETLAGLRSTVRAKLDGIGVFGCQPAVSRFCNCLRQVKSAVALPEIVGIDRLAAQCGLGRSFEAARGLHAGALAAGIHELQAMPVPIGDWLA